MWRPNNTLGYTVNIAAIIATNDGDPVVYGWGNAGQLDNTPEVKPLKKTPEKYL